MTWHAQKFEGPPVIPAQQYDIIVSRIPLSSSGDLCLEPPSDAGWLMFGKQVGNRQLGDELLVTWIKPKKRT